VLDSWIYCIKNKEMELYGWCIMSSHNTYDNRITWRKAGEYYARYEETYLGTIKRGDIKTSPPLWQVLSLFGATCDIK